MYSLLHIIECKHIDISACISWWPYACIDGLVMITSYFRTFQLTDSFIVLVLGIENKYCFVFITCVILKCFFKKVMGEILCETLFRAHPSDLRKSQSLEQNLKLQKLKNQSRDGDVNSGAEKCVNNRTQKAPSEAIGGTKFQKEMSKQTSMPSLVGGQKKRTSLLTRNSSSALRLRAKVPEPVPSSSCCLRNQMEFYEKGSESDLKISHYCLSKNRKRSKSCDPRVTLLRTESSSDSHRSLDTSTQVLVSSAADRKTNQLKLQQMDSYVSSQTVGFTLEDEKLICYELCLDYFI